MCLDIPILSSFIPEQFAEYALREQKNIKQNTLDNFKFDLYYSIASKKASASSVAGTNRYSSLAITQLAKQSFIHSHKKDQRPSKFIPIYNFFRHHTLVQHMLFQILLALIIAAVSFFQDWMILVPFSKLKTWFLSLPKTRSGEIGVHLGYSSILGAIAVFLTAGLSPQAGSGSGIPEVIAIMSGVSFPQFLRFRTMLAKVFGCMFAVASGLFVGRTGPMCSASFICSYLLMERIPFFRNFLKTESLKRSNLAIALAMGYAATMYSPIGGVLFSIELTSSVFPTRQYGRTFMAAVGAGILFRFLSYLDYSPLGKLPSSPAFPQIYEIPLFIVASVLIGLFVVLFIRLAKLVATLYRRIESWGTPHVVTSLDFPTQNVASFSGIKTVVNMTTMEAIAKNDEKRKQLQLRRLLGRQQSQASLRRASTTSMIPLSQPSSDPHTENPSQASTVNLRKTTTVSMRNQKRMINLKREMAETDAKPADKGSYSSRALKWLKSVWRRIVIAMVVSLGVAGLTIPYEVFGAAAKGGGGLFMDMMRNPLPSSYQSSWGGSFNTLATLALVTLIKVFIMPFCMQTAVPAGIVMPSLVTGSLLGRIIGQFLFWLSPTYFPTPETYAAVGATAYLAGATHTISPALIVIECTSMPNIALPCVIGAVCGYYVSQLFGGSLFDMIRDFRKIPAIKPILPESCDPNIQTVRTLMKSNQIFLTRSPTLREIRAATKKATLVNASYIPLIESKKDPVLVGAVTVSSLQTLLNNRTMLERAIIASINVPPLVDVAFIESSQQNSQLAFYQIAMDNHKKVMRNKEQLRKHRHVIQRFIPTKRPPADLFMSSSIKPFQSTNTLSSLSPSLPHYHPLSSNPPTPSLPINASDISHASPFSPQQEHHSPLIRSGNWNNLQPVDISDVLGKPLIITTPHTAVDTHPPTPISHIGSHLSLSSMVPHANIDLPFMSLDQGAASHPVPTVPSAIRLNPPRNSALNLRKKRLGKRHRRVPDYVVQQGVLNVDHTKRQSQRDSPLDTPNMTDGDGSVADDMSTVSDDTDHPRVVPQLRNEILKQNLEDDDVLFDMVARERLQMVKKDEELAVIEMNEQWVLIDDSPFQLHINTTLNKAQGIFTMLALNFCIVTDKGRYKGILFRSDFEQLFRTEHDVQRSRRIEKEKARKRTKEPQSAYQQNVKDAEELQETVEDPPFSITTSSEDINEQRTTSVNITYIFQYFIYMCPTGISNFKFLPDHPKFTQNQNRRLASVNNESTNFPPKLTAQVYILIIIYRMKRRKF
ncbi:putative Chloride channel protein clh-3 [Blattamonas nauphoetae]|uniref:Chloride channel protein clh-3 n=1 Tax=Blattamonas nauphoetae TaxID=2049346 RepID=A0ABQ9XP46_9EUKA|nr:putative Chloride channel protein clh-3 [Blattamonas nauphoetae]